MLTSSLVLLKCEKLISELNFSELNTFIAFRDCNIHCLHWESSNRQTFAIEQFSARMKELNFILFLQGPECSRGLIACSGIKFEYSERAGIWAGYGGFCTALLPPSPQLIQNCHQTFLGQSFPYLSWLRQEP